MMYDTTEQVTRAFREVVIREQLKKMLKDAKHIDIMFCAYDLSIQIEGYRLNPMFEGGKC
jgi:predicted ATP-dependent Lon-type protease